MTFIAYRLRRATLPAALALSLPLIGSPRLTTLAAQTRPVTVSVEVARLWIGGVYRGPLLINTPGGAFTLQRGAVNLDGLTLTSGRVLVQPSSWPFGLYVGAGFGHGGYRANGYSVNSSASLEADADVQTLAVGAFRSVPLGGNLPALDLGAGVTAVHFHLASAATYYGIPIQDFLSPGPELTLGLRYPAHGGRLRVELRSSVAVLYHDTEGLDGSLFGFPVDGPDHQWRPTAALGISAQLGF